MSTVIEADEIRRLAIAHLFARKAQSVATVDLRERSSLCDCFVLANCQSEVQLQAILSGLRRDLRKAGVPALRSECAAGSQWGVLDFGVVIVHVFMKDAREHYSLEKLWKDAPQEIARPEDYPLPKTDSVEDDAAADEGAESEETWS